MHSWKQAKRADRRLEKRPSAKLNGIEMTRGEKRKRNEFRRKTYIAGTREHLRATRGVDKRADDGVLGLVGPPAACPEFAEPTPRGGERLALAEGEFYETMCVRTRRERRLDCAAA